MDVTPPSTSFALGPPPDAAPVTRSAEPLVVVPSWRAPLYDVPAGFPRCHIPRVEGSVPSALTFQPREISKSSHSGPQWLCDALIRAYGQAAASIRYRTDDL